MLSSRHQKAYTETGSIRFAVSDTRSQYVLTSDVLPAFQGLTGIVMVSLQLPVVSYTRALHSCANYVSVTT
jgi:hypothetical protein